MRLRSEGDARLRKIVTLMNMLQSQNEISFYQKAVFYKELVFVIPEAIADLNSKKQLFDETMNQTYLTFSLFSLLRARPDLIEDGESDHLCRLLNDPKTDFLAKKNAFESLVRSLGVEFDSIGYNPSYKSDLAFQKKDSIEIKIHGCWMDVFKIL